MDGVDDSALLGLWQVILSDNPLKFSLGLVKQFPLPAIVPSLRPSGSNPLLNEEIASSGRASSSQ